MPALVVLALGLAACGLDAGASDSSAAQVAATSVPTAVPAADGLVTTRSAVTVLDDGAGPELCYMVLQSMPPQCEGTTLIDWSWADHPEHEHVSGTRWGDFVVTGTFDGNAITVTEATTQVAETPQPSEAYHFDTPCEPAGRWATIAEVEPHEGPHPSGVSFEAITATMEAANSLPGYANTWWDSRTEPEVLNVSVTHDLEAAETTLRKTWPGALCVSKARYSAAEQEALVAQLPDFMGGSVRGDLIEAWVLHDDGSLQAWVDTRFGPGRIRISSALVPAP